MNRMRNPLCLLLIAGCLESTAPPRPTVAPAMASAGPVLAMYVPGGTLEDSTVVRGSWQEDEGHFLPAGTPGKWGAASDDLREVVAGATGLPPDRRAHLSIWVAFGGARKNGWRGIRYADRACLTADARDDVFGNAGCYDFVDEKAD